MEVRFKWSTRTGRRALSNPGQISYTLGIVSFIAVQKDHKLIKDVAIEERHRRATLWAENSIAQGGSASLPSVDTTAVAPPNTVTVNPAVTAVAPPNTVTVNPMVATVVPRAVALQQINSVTPVTATGPPSQAISPTPQAAVSSGVVSSSPQTLATLAAASPSLNVVSTGPAPSPPAHLFDPTLIPRAPHTPVVSPSTEPEFSPFSKFMVATEQLYEWQDGDAGNLVLPQFNAYDELHPAAHWSNPAPSVFTPTAYQDMQGVDPATAASAAGYSPAISTNVLGHVTFSPMTAHSSHVTDLASNVTIPNASATAGDNVTFTATGVANGTAAQLVQSPALNPVLNTTTNLNSIPAETGGGHVEEANKSRPRKRKSHEEESAQLILPDGTRRRKKPRHVDENYVLSTVGRKGRAGKKARIA